jgi:hypothetical protein
MAKKDQNLVSILRIAAKNLSEGNEYQWGHHGSCNCGNLLQAASNLNKSEIHKYAQSGNGEWSELAEDYCGVIDAPFQFLVAKFAELGLNSVDIHNIEYLSDAKVLKNLKGGFRHLARNQRNDVIEYFLAFADLIEADINADQEIKSIMDSPVEIKSKIESPIFQ